MATRVRNSVCRSPWLGAAAVAVLTFLLADAAARSTGFNPDESRWLSRAHYLTAFADPFGPVWADQYMTRGQPPLGSYIMGVGLLLQGQDLWTNPPWDFSISWERNIAVGNKPGAADLAAGRRTSAILAALTAAALVGVSRVFLPLGWALAAGAFFALHPFTSYIGSLATADAVFGLTIVLATLATGALARQPSTGRAALFGVMLGLGAATKLSPLVLAAAIGCAGTGALVARMSLPRKLPRGVGALAFGGVVAAVTAVVVFVVVYPYLWPDPIGRTASLFEFRAAEMAQQAADWPVMAVPTRIEALRRVALNFGERHSAAAVAAAAMGWTAPPVVRFGELLLPLAGLMALVHAAIRAGPLSPRALMLVVLGGQVLVTIVGMRSEFDRYHLPMALLGAVAAAAGLHFLVDRLLALRSGIVWPERHEHPPATTIVRNRRWFAAKPRRKMTGGTKTHVGADPK